MTKQEAITQLDRYHSAGMLAQETFNNAIARLDSIERDKAMHYRTKQNRYEAVVAIATTKGA